MSWKDLAEMAPMLSEAEVRFEKKRRLVGLLLGPVLFVLVVVAPPLQHVSPLGMRTLGIFLWTVLWWVTEPIPIPATSFFALSLLVVGGILTVPEAFGYWANWVNIFFMGAFIIAHAMNLHGLTHRLAYRMVSSRWLGGSPWRLLILFGLGPALLSAVMSNVATTMIFLSIALGLAETLQFSREGRFGEALFISIAWGAGVGGILTPVGTPPNMIAIGLLSPLGYRVGFAQWTLAALPMAVVAMIAMYLVIRYVIRPEMGGWKISATSVEERLRQMGPMKRGEKIAAGALAAAIALWMLPDLVPLFLEGGRKHPVSVWLTGHLDWSVSAMLVATSLFLIPVDWRNRRFAMTWPEAVKGIEWGTLSLVAAALALGNVIADREKGLGVFFSEMLSSLAAPGTSHLLFLLALITFTISLTNLASNIAVVSMVGTLAVAVGPSAGINPVALMVTVALASSMAFSLPISTPPNAIVFASGQIRVGTMVKSGTIFSLICVFLLLLFGVSLAEWIFPWGN
ncbi:MAG: anion permease [Acidobacteria bacterium]|nr:anion permease [Acidobacteriota bacterium]